MAAAIVLEEVEFWGEYFTNGCLFMCNSHTLASHTAKARGPV